MDERAVKAAVISAFLRVGKPIDHASSLWLALAVVLSLELGGRPAVLATSLALALLEKYFAWRVALDAHLFTVLAQYPEPAAFDAALADCLGSKQPRAPRTLAQRWAGARRLLFGQLAASALQLACLGALQSP